MRDNIRPTLLINKTPCPLPNYSYFYKTALLDDVLPFWQRHSPDREHGGYFTCLNRDGGVFDTDKFTWLQAPQVHPLYKRYCEYFNIQQP